MWIPGQRRWVQMDSLPGYRSPQESAAAARPLVETLTEESRIPPTVVMAAASAETTASRHRPTVPAQSLSDDVASIADVTAPRVLLTDAVESLVGTPLPGRVRPAVLPLLGSPRPRARRRPRCREAWAASCSRSRRQSWNPARLLGQGHAGLG